MKWTFVEGTFMRQEMSGWRGEGGGVRMEE